jgi:hypothetical protein
MVAGVCGAVAGELSQEDRARQRRECAGLSMLLLLLLVDAFYMMSILIVLMSSKMFCR